MIEVQLEIKSHPNLVPIPSLPFSLFNRIHMNELSPVVFKIFYRTHADFNRILTLNWDQCGTKTKTIPTTISKLVKMLLAKHWLRLPPYPFCNTSIELSVEDKPNITARALMGILKWPPKAQAKTFLCAVSMFLMSHSHWGNCEWTGGSFW